MILMSHYDFTTRIQYNNIELLLSPHFLTFHGNVKLKDETYGCQKKNNTSTIFSPVIPLVFYPKQGRLTPHRTWESTTPPSVVPCCILMALQGNLPLNTDKGAASLQSIPLPLTIVGILQNWAHIHCTAYSWLHQESGP